ncbi:MAG: hypothetical protein AAF529_09380 [Pseudomonadota bacterium]
MSRPEQHRQLLVHVEVSNAAGEISDRFVDHQLFALWRALVEDRHGLHIKGCTPCVWLPEGEARRHESLAQHQPFRVDVHRLTFQCFDPATSITEFKSRFVLATEALWMTDLLLKHLGDEEFTTLKIHQGQALATRAAA